MTAYQLLLFGDIAEEDWSKSNSEEEKKELESTISFSMIALCVSLRGGGGSTDYNLGPEHILEGNSESSHSSYDDDTQGNI